MKKRKLLDTLIRTYITSHEPVSSKKLQSRLDFKLSSATIRYYFKQLTELGELEKLHASSGRIPSQKALRLFWYHELGKKPLKFALDSLEDAKKLARELKIFCEYVLFHQKIFQRLERIRHEYLIIEIEEKRFILSYHPKLESILRSFQGITARELVDVLVHLGLLGVAEEMKKSLIKERKFFNIEELLKIAETHPEWAKRGLIRLMNGKSLLNASQGLKIEGDILRYKFGIKTPKGEGEMLLMGPLDRDYQNFLHQLKRSEDGK